MVLLLMFLQKAIKNNSITFYNHKSKNTKTIRIDIAKIGKGYTIAYFMGIFMV